MKTPQYNIIQEEPKNHQMGFRAPKSDTWAPASHDHNSLSPMKKHKRKNMKVSGISEFIIVQNILHQFRHTILSILRVTQQYPM